MSFDPADIPIIGNLFKSHGQKKLEQRLAAAGKQYEAYRPIAMQARMNGLRNVLSPGMLGPINQQLAHMYGPGAVFDTSPLLQDPLAAAKQLAESQAADARSQKLMAKHSRPRVIGQPTRPEELNARNAVFQKFYPGGRR